MILNKKASSRVAQGVLLTLEIYSQGANEPLLV